MSFRHVSRGGSYFRVADPDWEDPLDGVPGVARGGRWNEPGAFPVVYLNQTRSLARKFVAHKLEDQPYSPHDLDPATGPILVRVSLREKNYVDVVSDRGCLQAGLPDSYPRDDAGRTIPHRTCWPIGQDGWDRGESGIACRSATKAAAAADEELAWFQRAEMLTAVDTEPFASWFFGEV